VPHISSVDHLAKISTRLILASVLPDCTAAADPGARLPGAADFSAVRQPHCTPPVKLAAQRSCTLIAVKPPKFGSGP
jgi:hypothetical protein